MRQVQDHYFRKAKKEGYPARSVYKLEEAQNKHRFLKKGGRVLDIGPIDKLRSGEWETTALAPGEATVRSVKNLADPELTDPSIAFVPHSKGRVEE